MSNQRNEQLSQLYRAVLSLRSEEECRAFLEDLCTIQEVEDMRKRLEVARLLDGGVNYQEIGQQTGMSTATISRVNRSLRYGAEGYRLVLARLKGEDKVDANR